MSGFLICDRCEARPTHPNIYGPLPWRGVLPEGWTGHPQQQTFCPKCSQAKKLEAERV